MRLLHFAQTDVFLLNPNTVVNQTEGATDEEATTKNTKNTK